MTRRKVDDELTIDLACQSPLWDRDGDGETVGESDGGVGGLDGNH